MTAADQELELCSHPAEERRLVIYGAAGHLNVPTGLRSVCSGCDVDFGGVPVGTELRLTADELGIMAESTDVRFLDRTTKAGETGLYAGEHPSENLPGWILVDVEDGFVPVTPAMVELVKELEG